MRQNVEHQFFFLYETHDPLAVIFDSVGPVFKRDSHNKSSRVSLLAERI